MVLISRSLSRYDDGESSSEDGESITLDELVTDEDKALLKSGEITEERFEEVLRTRLEEKGYLEHEIHISVVADDYSMTISVNDGEVDFDFELI